MYTYTSMCALAQRIKVRKYRIREAAWPNVVQTSTRMYVHEKLETVSILSLIENIVTTHKNSDFASQLQALRTGMSQLMELAGMTSSDADTTPKTSAKLRGASSRSNRSTKSPNPKATSRGNGKSAEALEAMPTQVDIPVTEGRFKVGRLKLPPAMFRKGTWLTVDGVKYEQTADQGRSTNITFTALGYDRDSVDLGDTFRFDLVDGKRAWSVDLLGTGVATPRASTKSGKGRGTTKKTSKPVRVETESDALSDGERDKRFFKTIEEFAAEALSNKRKGIINEDVIETDAKSKYDLDFDARMYLPTAVNTKFRAWRKKKARLSFSEAIEALNEACLELDSDFFESDED